MQPGYSSDDVGQPMNQNVTKGSDFRKNILKNEMGLHNF
jgi:hypothetical protein